MSLLLRCLLPAAVAVDRTRCDRSALSRIVLAEVVGVIVLLLIAFVAVGGGVCRLEVKVAFAHVVVMTSIVMVKFSAVPRVFENRFTLGVKIFHKV